MEQFGRLRQKDGKIDLPPEALTQASCPAALHHVLSGTSSGSGSGCG